MRFVVLILGLQLLSIEPASAYPLLSPRPIASALAGPTDPHVAATFYNPAALGPLKGYHFYLEGGPRLQFGSIALDSGGGSVSAFAASFDGFFGASWDLANDYVTAAVSIAAPFNEFSSFGPTLPTRYHQIFSRFGLLQETLAVSIRLYAQRLYVGVAVHFGELWIDSSFSRLESGDTLRLRGDNNGTGFSIGILAVPVSKLWIGASFTSHMFSQSGNDVWLRRYGRADDPQATNSLVIMATPDIVHIGVRGEVHPRLDLESTVRYVHYHARPRTFDISLFGPAAEPTQFSLNLGIQDAWAVELSGRIRLAKSFRLSPSLTFETAAVGSDTVSAAALDAHKFDVALTAEWTPVTYLRLGAHVGAIGYLLGHVVSRYQGGAQADCRAANYDLGAIGCQQVFAGDALPSSSGNYSLWQLHFGASIAADFW